MQPQLAADTRFHLRQETFNLDAEPTIAEWLVAGRVDLLAFNDHMDMTTASMSNPKKRMRMVERSGLSESGFDSLVQRVLERASEVPASIERLAAIACDQRIPLLSHDDKSPEQRTGFRALGINLAEFPINEETARAATAAGDFTVFGAPNVVRGGSHTGWTSAAEMVSKGLCSILASDYYYPPPARGLHAGRRQRPAASAGMVAGVWSTSRSNGVARPWPNLARKARRHHSGRCA
jgi:alpha-D-ribose 1-methylphosphonate 5-triphosphate diphosphatase